ncbi:unnamed protein product [Adineta ricciae]|uniref:Uncharacterized protein n=1 Tax=Adineta ricciae TaxID=249248 RepID=A0A815KKT9_ADIRI|nr:unnamed protein product [Adineta ricciae]CAF1537279.1 unnamed protein product [Adineta ricciae]
MKAYQRVINLWYIFCFSSTFLNSFVLIYHTENSPSVQHYDCIYYTQTVVSNHIPAVKYCRQLNESQPLERDFNQSCHNGGHLWSFEKLSALKVSPSEVLQWSSSVEQVDRYSKYLSNNSTELKNHYLCNCSNPSSFGKFCEYLFYGQSISFHDAITKQFQPFENYDMHTNKIYVGRQLHENRPCYITWICNSGSMCLDWRHICDGKQQCMDGIDEDYCEKLEFNECEDDEYRCANGMCIPDEYWLDGDYDCMDWTDEKDTLVGSGFGCFTTPSVVCDEHLCPYVQWSCGDGQCIPYTADRHTGLRSSRHNFCHNMRDVNFMCESVIRESRSWWTIDNGYCLPYSVNYQTLGLDSTVSTDKCNFSIKCALTYGLNKDCQCKNATACRSTVLESCSKPYVFYPGSGPLLTPQLDMVYERDHDWTKKKPDIYGLHGRAKCIGYQFITKQRRFYKVTQNMYFYDPTTFEYILCIMITTDQGIRSYTGPHYDVNCWNDSKTFNNHSYQVSFRCFTRCISKYRVRDGISDCFNNNDELSNLNNSCLEIQRHRFQCSSSELTCLLVGAVGDTFPHCSNQRDEFQREVSAVPMRNVNCIEREGLGCTYLREYIETSSKNNSNGITVVNSSLLSDHLVAGAPFQLYCDSFFNINSPLDESIEFCKNWICPRDQYQCLSGQCISLSWVCDGEWDCGDGSDEQGLFAIDRLNEHNSMLKNLSELQGKCAGLYRFDNVPFSDICNISREYPCFRSGIDDPLNVTKHRPCINLTQIGDGKTDCLTALDERNRLRCTGYGMLGFYLQLNNGFCATYRHLCTDTLKWIPTDDVDYNAACFYQKFRFENISTNVCNGTKDVMCLNGTCIKDARCNDRRECSHGEDEYRCLSLNQESTKYRELKDEILPVIQLKNYPSQKDFLIKMARRSLIENERNHSFVPSFNSKSNDEMTRVFGSNHSGRKTVYEIVRDSVEEAKIEFSKDYLPYICNRGVAVKYFTGHTVCFCPSSFYGEQCQFYSDRITVLTHLDLNNYRSFQNTIKVLAAFLFEDKIIDYYEFHVDPRRENEKNFVKQQIYFVYPRSKEFLQIKKTNRNGTQLYKVQFEIFQLHLNGEIEISGVWKYPIYFDFLPSFRLAKILRFPSDDSTTLPDPCLNHLCSENGICQKIINSNSSESICSCKSGYYGIRCERYDEKCQNYCSPKSICKPKSRGILTDNQGHPLCLCSTSTFGTECYFKNDNSARKLCFNGGTYVLLYDFTNISRFICICTDFFQGIYCETPKPMINILLLLSENSVLQRSDVVAATVASSDYDIRAVRFNTPLQKVYAGFPSELKLSYEEKVAPNAPIKAVLRVYEKSSVGKEAKYFLLYFQFNPKAINLTIDLTSESHCPPVETLWHLIENTENVDNSSFNSTTSVFFYHRICQLKNNTNTTLICFRDLRYLCICESDYYRAECFEYDRSLDQCSSCLANGYCLKGELNNKSDFLCICPRCFNGKMCQDSTELMSITLDSLITKDIQNDRHISVGIYISFSLLIFFFALFNNFNSFLTFLRPKARQMPVGIYLLIVSVIDQCSLSLLFLKIVHVILGSNGILFEYESVNLYSCKILSYLLSVFTRITYWLTSLVTIERLCLVLFPTSPILKSTRRALGLSLFIIIFVFSMHIHELINYRTIVDFSYTSTDTTLCVTSYVQTTIAIYNRVNVLFHYFIPFLIQIISITILIIQLAFSRARANKNKKQTFTNLLMQQLKEQKEQYVVPIIIVFSSLPQTITSFSYACTELKQSWQRYILLTTYFFSYLPQMLGFILYVLPSTTFSEEFHQTRIGKIFLRLK